LDDLVSNYAGKSVLLVTHGGTARALITTALGLGVRYFHRIQQSNGGLSRLCFPALVVQARLELLNDTSHLGESLPKLKEGKKGVRLLLVSANGSSPEDCRHLSSVFERLAVDCVFPVGPEGRDAASAIFRRHSEPAGRLLCERNTENILRGVLSKTTGEGPCNVALVAPPSFLRGILERQLGLAYPEKSLLLHRPGITALHCPAAGIPSVLQSLNAFEPQTIPTGACA
jgi:probable phosphoglycerate mutase